MLKKILNKVIYPHTYSSDAFVKFLKKNNVSVGEGTWFVKPKNTVVDIQNANFIDIGSDVCITEGVVILAHDWSYSVIAKKYKIAPGKQKVTKIGNNVFIGMNAIILMGSDIGDNVIIGAGSVVSGKVDSDSVYAGNPAKKICTLEEYKNKLESSFEDSAYCYFKRSKAKNGEYPDLKKVGIYASLFIEKDEESMKKYFSFSSIPYAIKNMKKKYETIDELMEKYDDEKKS